MNFPSCISSGWHSERILQEGSSPRKGVPIGCPMTDSPENVHTSNIVWHKQGIFVNACVYTCMHAIPVNE